MNLPMVRPFFRQAGIAALASLAVSLVAGPARAAEDFSPAEQAIFMADQLRNVKPPATLRYTFQKTGSLEPGFQDSVAVALKPRPDGRCCTASGDFLTGERKLRLPDVEDAKGNPVVLYFLERDIREMHRLAKGPENYFRKRIRMAIYQGATVKPATFRYKGRDVAGQEIAISPYLDDPNRARFEKFATREYRFLLSDAVPGGVYGIRSVVPGAAGAPSLVGEEMLIDGAEPAKP
jgi:hypothetical protein